MEKITAPLSNFPSSQRFVSAVKFLIVFPENIALSPFLYIIAFPRSFVNGSKDLFPRKINYFYKIAEPYAVEA